MTTNRDDTEALRQAMAAAASREFAMYCAEVDEELLRGECKDCGEGEVCSCVRSER